MPPLMIFAAGMGTRMRPLTDHRPKPLIEVAGQSLLDRALNMARDAGASPVVVNTHYLGEQITAHLNGQNIALSDETDLLRETGGGLRKALPLLGPGPVMTLNPDVVWTGPNPLTALLDAWDARMDALLTVVPLERATARIGGGDFSLDAQQRITRKGDFVYAGAHMIRPERLAEISDEVFSLNRIWDVLIEEGRAFATIHTGNWCDVGTPQAIPQAEAMLANG